MLDRRGEWMDEMVTRCAFKDEEHEPVADKDVFAAEAGITPQQVEAFGYWFVIKAMTRVILPEVRVKVGVPEVFLTGSGTGGFWAAIVSMWLVKLDATTYSTFVFGPESGWQCAARAMFSADTVSSATHSQIFVYSHVMDAYAGSVDRIAGLVCLYGLRNFTEGDVAQSYCSQAIGYSGPQLFYRSSETVTPTEEILLAQRAFDACHYFTHSIWYATALFLSEEVLFLDGSTDGGCFTQDSVDEDDPLTLCPTYTKADVQCTLLEDTVQPMPYEAISYVMGGLTGLICCVAAIGTLCLKRARNEGWIEKARAAMQEDMALSRADQARARAVQKRADEEEKLKLRAWRKENPEYQEKKERVKKKMHGVRAIAAMGLALGSQSQETEKLATSAEDGGGGADADADVEASARGVEHYEDPFAAALKDKKDKKDKKNKKDRKTKKDRKNKDDDWDAEEAAPDVEAQAEDGYDYDYDYEDASSVKKEKKEKKDKKDKKREEGEKGRALTSRRPSCCTVKLQQKTGTRSFTQSTFSIISAQSVFRPSCFICSALV